VAKAGREPRGAGESGGRGRWMVPQGEGAGVSPTGRGMCSFFAGSSARVCSVRFLEWKIVFGSDFLALWSRRLGTITSEIQIKNCLSVKSKNQKNPVGLDREILAHWILLWRSDTHTGRDVGGKRRKRGI
jgi:hypothetical protein